MTVSLPASGSGIEFDAQVKDVCNQLRMIPVNKGASSFPLRYMLNSPKLCNDLGKEGYLAAYISPGSCRIRVDGVWQKELPRKYRWNDLQVNTFCETVGRFTLKKLKLQIENVHFKQQMKKILKMTQLAEKERQEVTPMDVSEGHSEV